MFTDESPVVSSVFVCIEGFKFCLPIVLPAQCMRAYVEPCFELTLVFIFVYPVQKTLNSNVKCMHVMHSSLSTYPQDLQWMAGNIKR